MNLFGYTLDGLRDYFSGIGENPAKAGILFDAVYKRGVRDFAELGFSERVTSRLCGDLSLELPKITEKLESADAAKLLLELSDGELIETVLMRQRFGNCVCVSTQVGCNMGCAFCQSGFMKKRRDLATEEIVGQVLAISSAFDCKIDGVSVMGIGEPFDNFQSVSDFIAIISHDKGLAVGRRHVTVSTCGIVPRIYDYADLPAPCSLAISLHAPNDALRSRLMPINKKYPIADVLDAAEYYSNKTKHRVALEYIMLSGVNDSDEHARELAKIIAGRDFYVNLIPYNSTDSEFTKSDAARLAEFCGVLKDGGVIATKRREFGADLKAACGQLRADRSAKSK
ncbi:MAG: 23S rRNA (adenine(2503)-C(2))-methyltransferase RlmN [Oscillospiraceae bacterium]|nr:23S rRNA (adenine(2503)-C(2))-methyltransferase RlmN [Oscillospiraceae bacterium]